jgi:predicted nuclease of predicted toxin-antitoxin system
VIRFLVDEDFNNDLVRGLLRRVPDADLVRVQDLGLRGATDDTVLARPPPKDESS